MRKGRNFEKARERALLAFGATIFRKPQLLVQAHWHRLKGSISVAPHAHTGIIQLDLNIGMTGTITIAKREISIRGVTAVAFYPGQEHSIDLMPAAPEAEIFSVKIRVSPGSEILKKKIFPACLNLLLADHYLVRALRQLNRIATVETARKTMVCSTLAQVVCYWPSAPSGSECELQNNSDEVIGAGMQNALRRIDDRLAHPPSVKELASVSNMSARNFTRHFRYLFGCAPHAYITARRLACAREFLAHKSHNITEISEELGFPSIHAFSRWFQRIVGTSPTVYREKNFLL
jgi:AraC family transcriptional regulator